MKFLEKFGNTIMFFDGAMGTMLQRNGLKAGELPENMNITSPETILKIHKMYVDAGCNVITANTFGANSLKFNNVEEIITAGVCLAKKSIENADRDCYTALDIGPLGKLLKPYGDLDFDVAYDLYKEQVTAGERAGADLILIETMGDLYEIKAAVLAAKENSDLPVLVSMIFDEKGILLTGADIKTAVITLEGLGVDGIGMNCGLGPDQMLELLEEMRAFSSTPIFVQPNAGLPVSVNGVTTYNVTPRDFAEKQLEIVRAGAVAVGGCCGTTPEYIKVMTELCKNEKVEKPYEKGITAVTSYSKTAIFGRIKPLIIGERINPTGKKMLKEALRNNDMDYIYREGISQADAGAHILDVNVGLPEINEPEMMKNAVSGLQSILDIPLQIDTSDVVAMEKALRIYNGKPMINSVNGKEETMNTVFPLVKKYGGVVVCLTLDENGIPETVDGRLEIAEKIIKKASEYGIPKYNLVFDPLCMTVSTNKGNAEITLQCVKRLHCELGVHTVLGVSNVSFGLPNRELLNSTFFTLALQKGLSAGIINPKSDAMMNSYYSYLALRGLDNNFESYIANVTDTKTEVKNTDVDLKTAVIKGLKEQAKAQTEKELKTKTPLEIIDGILIPALDFVGKGFEENRVFLPGLLMSAETAGASFEIIKNHLIKSGVSEKKKGKIVIATVKGDIHDIGKNIVKVLLENYGYDVVDLGKDVSSEQVLDAVKKENARLVGLSALMTTTVPAMKETIELLKSKIDDVSVMVGGAVLTEEYAKLIGADYYSKDAMSSVRFAEKFFAK